MDIKAKIEKALEEVHDPEIHKSLVELDMVGDITVEGESALINITLTTIKCPLKSTIGEDVKSAVKKVEGIKNVEVVFGEMSQTQKEALITKLHGNKESKNSFENTRIIAVGSGKGGVGKSSVTAGIAVALSKAGHRVGLIDADILGHSIPQIMGTKYEKPNVINENFLMPIEKYGVKIMSMGNLVETNEAFIWRGPMLSKVLQQFLEDVYWGELDYLLIDMPPGTGDIPLNIMQSNLAADILVVTTPQSFASGVAIRLGLMANKTGAKIIGVIENMSYFICDNCSKKHYIFGKGESEELCKQLDTKLLGTIPVVSLEDENMDGKLLLDGQAPVLVEAFKNIAEKLIAERI